MDMLPLQLQHHVAYVQSFVTRFFDHIDPESPQLKGNSRFDPNTESPLGDEMLIIVAVAAIAFNPIFWNFAARSGTFVFGSGVIVRME